MLSSSSLRTRPELAGEDVDFERRGDQRRPRRAVGGGLGDRGRMRGIWGLLPLAFIAGARVSGTRTAFGCITIVYVSGQIVYDRRHGEACIGCGRVSIAVLSTTCPAAALLAAPTARGLLLFPVEMIEILAQYGFNGLILGANYALIGIGLTMIFGIMNIANFAHGQFYMLGGFFAYMLVAKMGLHYLVALPLAVLGVAAVGWVLERLIFARLRDRSSMTCGARHHRPRDPSRKRRAAHLGDRNRNRSPRRSRRCRCSWAPCS
jgi:hypothetical protein